MLVSLKTRPAWVAATALAGYLLAAMLLAGLSWTQAWSALGVQSMMPPFADLHVMTSTFDVVAAGETPYRLREFGHRTLIFNYPHNWLWLGAAGIREAHTSTLGILTGTSLFGVFTALFTGRLLSTWSVGFGLIISPPVLLVVERGNSDIIILVTLLIGLALSAVLSSRFRVPTKILLCISLTMLKIYPVAALMVLVASRRSLLLVIGLAIITAAVFYVSLWPGEAEFIFLTPQRATLSFGSLPVIMAADRLLGLGSPVELRAAAAIFAVICGSAGVAIGWRWRDRVSVCLPPLVHGRWRDDAALACLAIFCLAFVLGSNWDYRLIFLIVTAACPLTAYEKALDRRLLAWPALCLLFTWLGPLSRQILLFDEVLGWMLFLAGCAWLGATAAGRIGAGAGGSRATLVA